MAIYNVLPVPSQLQRALQLLVLFIALPISSLALCAEQPTQDSSPSAITDPIVTSADQPVSNDNDKSASGSLRRAPVSDWLNKEATQARVVSVSGNVLLRNSPEEAAITLKTGMLVDVHAQVETTANSVANFILEDGSILKLSADSLLGFKRLYRYGSTSIRDVQLFLHRGRLENNIQPRKSAASRFEIVTPSAVTGVRGTEYRVSVEVSGATTRVAVIEGAVAVASGGKELVVTSGYATLAALGEKPVAPRTLLSAPNLDGVAGSYESVIAFMLPAMVEVTEFRVQLMADSAVLFDRTGSDASIQIGNIPAGQYQLVVSAIDELGIEGSHASKSISLLELAEASEPPVVEEKSNWLSRLLFLGGIIFVLL